VNSSDRTPSCLLVCGSQRGTPIREFRQHLTYRILHIDSRSEWRGAATRDAAAHTRGSEEAHRARAALLVIQPPPTHVREVAMPIVGKCRPALPSTGARIWHAPVAHAAGHLFGAVDCPFLAAHPHRRACCQTPAMHSGIAVP